MNLNKRKINRLMVTLLVMLLVSPVYSQIRPNTNLKLSKIIAVNAKYLPLYQWYSPSRGDNFLTTNPKWAGKAGDKKSPDYRFVRIEGYIFSPLNKQPANTVPVYSWYSPSRGDNFLTSNPNYAPSKATDGKHIGGYTFVRKEGYIYTKSFTDRIMLQSHWSPGRKDNFASAHSAYRGAIGKKTAPDYKLYRTEGYVIAPSKIGKYNATQDSKTVDSQTNKSVIRLDDKRKYTSVNTRSIKDLKKFTPVKITPVGTGNTDRQGVNMDSYEDIENLLKDNEFEPFFEKLNIFRNIYEDKNKQAKYYYYLPSTYTLKWDKGNGKYAFNIFYMSSDNEEKGDVLIKAELVSNIDKEDLLLAEKFIKRKTGKVVQLMPFDVQGVSIDFGSTLTNFNVESESVGIIATSDFLKPIVVNWKMKSNVDDFVTAMLNNIGINASIDFIPVGTEDRVISVPVNLQVNDPITFGKIEINNSSELINGWINYLDYPIIVNQITLQRKGTAAGPYLESIDYNSDEIAPGQSFAYNDNRISLINNNTQRIERIWLNYSITDCDGCNKTVKKKIVGGTSGSQITNLEIQILNIMETSEAYMFKLNLKSIQADPNGANEVTLPSITIKEDDQSFSGGKYYVPENEELSYQYQLVQIMPDGQTLNSPWKNGNQSFLVIGEKQLETIFSEEEESGEIKDENSLESVADSLINKGKKLLEDLFKKKDEDEETEEGGN